MIEVASFGIACYLPHGGTENPLISPLLHQKTSSKAFLLCLSLRQNMTFFVMKP